MKVITLTLDEKDLMEMEAILMDGDRERAFHFVKDVIKMKVRGAGSANLDVRKGMGIR
ncbi:MAG: hypothetical protein JRH07_17685 [Deltaproteobacteria bacterium]|nr:hypothetical protein [Deltaproteobacteria bacterium]MBW2123653.1 hypothetical protein [Deltaproteobacteria bacterium]